MSAISKGNKLPTVEVQKKGELVSEKGSIKQKPWTSECLTGKARVINHIAGRSAAKEINEAMISALKAAEFPQDAYQTTTIINLNDAMWGTSAIVAAKAESGKKEFPWSSVVLDEKGDVAKAWGLKKESSAIAVLDAEGEVLFFKDGALSAAEVQEVIGMIEAELEAACA